MFTSSFVGARKCALVFPTNLDQRMPTGGTTMRRILFVGLLALLSLGFVRAQRQPYRVVFDLTSRDSLEQKAVLRWLREVGTSSPDAQMEVVMKQQDNWGYIKVMH
jgi:hypothetical protein